MARLVVLIAETAFFQRMETGIPGMDECGDKGIADVNHGGPVLARRGTGNPANSLDGARPA